MVGEILIIKLGAIGDVIRTTPILRVIKGDITWVTNRESIPLLKNPYIKKVIDFSGFKHILKKRFDWAINLEEDWKARALTELVNATRKTNWIKDWCRLSIDDNAKKINNKSYQHFLFKTIGFNFSGEEYVIGERPKEINENIIGIEMRSGDIWKMKQWNQYPRLIKLLKQKGLKVKIFRHRDNILDFVSDVNSCSVIVSGDTLAMHLGLGLKKKVVAIFGPTSSSEIFSYGRMKKIVSPILCQCCYKRECDKKPNCMDLISAKEIFLAILEMIER
jgi:heptosyltransferase-2